MAYKGHHGRFDTSKEVKALADGLQIEYTISKDHYQSIIADKPRLKAGDNYHYALEYINNVYGFRGKVTKLNIEK